MLRDLSAMGLTLIVQNEWGAHKEALAACLEGRSFSCRWHSSIGGRSMLAHIEKDNPSHYLEETADYSHKMAIGVTGSEGVER